MPSALRNHPVGRFGRTQACPEPSRVPTRKRSKFSPYPLPPTPYLQGIAFTLLLSLTTHASLPVPADTTDLRDIRQTTLVAPEELLFDIIWGGWSFNWVRAGTATLDLLPTSNPKVWEIRSVATGNRFFQSFYPVNDTVVSFINARGVYPLKFHKILNEGSYRARQWMEFDPRRGRVTTQDTVLMAEPFTHDVLSAFYYARTQPLKPGQSFDLSAVSGKKAYKLRVLVHREETVEVPAGRFDTWVIEPVLRDDGLFKAKGRLWIWVTRDERRMPVKMQSKIPVGSIRAELVKVGGRE
jgi:hypothetical protein